MRRFSISISISPLYLSSLSFLTYAPAGIARTAVAVHHDNLLRNVRLLAPDAEVGHQAIITAGD